MGYCVSSWPFSFAIVSRGAGGRRGTNDAGAGASERGGASAELQSGVDGSCFLPLLSPALCPWRKVTALERGEAVTARDAACLSRV